MDRPIVFSVARHVNRAWWSMNARLFLLPVIDVRGLLSKVYIYIIAERRLTVSASLIQTNAIIAGIWQARKEETVSNLLVTVNVFIRPRDRPFLLIKKPRNELDRDCQSLVVSSRTRSFFLSFFHGFPIILDQPTLDHLDRSQEIGQRSLSLSITSPWISTLSAISEEEYSMNRK